MADVSGLLERIAGSHQRYLIANATVPVALVDGAPLSGDVDGLARVDILVEAGRVASVTSAGGADEGADRLELDRGMVLPLFVDMHTHLDKGHIWPRRRNPDGRFMSALLSVKADREAAWTAEDVRRRMDFSLRTAYAHGTRAIRTHLDSIPPQHEISWPVFRETRDAWAGRIDLQAVSLVGPDTMMEPATLDVLARTVKAAGGSLGGAIGTFPTAREAVFNVVRAAQRHGLDIDLHLDETEDPNSTSLRFLAEAIIELGFEGRAIAGHCCSLARQGPEAIDWTLDLVARAGIAIVSLPMCNMFLQDRHLALDDEATEGPRRTPRWRGVTLIHEMKARGIPVAVASDNTRDPFYAYGDLDGLEVLREAVRILHFDHPIGDWPGVMTRFAADIIGLPARGRIAPGLPADLALFRGRTWTELFSRPQSDRVILRDGAASKAEPPDYRELDDLFGAEA
ncbi:cytosine deaminase [Chthonobacter albigriseus]|uniref:cytosine deaminase n=1 Tax=Chthonobacter albigriseus TaxID=1683161 RepID=UPI0015EE39A2|nr:cytosine deaminase [Chthonobacter albigriseus]